MSLRVIWQNMDRYVTNKYYMDLRSFGPYTIFLVTERSIYCHVTLSAMNYLLYILTSFRGSRCRDHMVVGFITTCAIIAYHH